ncbi:MAG TPA: DUF2059 domain-containing protein [Terriglobales bacterium]|nr:DUF2059 domain-containing protein [Terriglobales bacterium]
MRIATVLAWVALFTSAVAYSQTNTQSPSTDLPTTAATKIDPAKEADIRRLLEVTGAAGLATQMMDQMEHGIRPLMTNSLPPGEYREKLVELFFEKFKSKIDSNQLTALIIPIYDKHYTQAEIKSLIQFYESPLGRKVATSMPQVLAESQAAGGQWGQQIGRDSMIEVLQEHPDLRQALENAKGTPRQ